MHRHHFTLSILGLSLLVVGGCSSDSGGSNNGNQTGADGGGGGSGAGCDTTYANVPTEPVSLKTDLMPVFGLSCVARQCHNGDDKKADLYLGVKCDYNKDDPHFKCT